MPDYAIGDLQGCYEPFMRLLEHIRFDEKVDRLWFVGDLVNRGPESLEVLRFIKNLPLQARITLGNHDLHLLVRLFTKQSRKNKDDTLLPILNADDGEELGHWLRNQSILHHDASMNVVMCHAGIAPVWDLELAKACARELEHALAGDNYRDFLSNMYGDEPGFWSPGLTGYARLRIITNFFTRMRFCDLAGRLLLDYKGTIKKAPPGFLPWFALPDRQQINADIVFGHWAALQGSCSTAHLYAIDTGCLWGGKLTALRLQDRRLFAVNGLSL